MMEKKLLLGDEAVALGALDAGLSGVYARPLWACRLWANVPLCA